MPRCKESRGGTRESRIQQDMRQMNHAPQLPERQDFARPPERPQSSANRVSTHCTPTQNTGRHRSATSYRSPADQQFSQSASQGSMIDHDGYPNEVEETSSENQPNRDRRDPWVTRGQLRRGIRLLEQAAIDGNDWYGNREDDQRPLDLSRIAALDPADKDLLCDIFGPLEVRLMALANEDRQELCENVLPDPGEITHGSMSDNEAVARATVSHSRSPKPLKSRKSIDIGDPGAPSSDNDTGFFNYKEDGSPDTSGGTSSTAYDTQTSSLEVNGVGNFLFGEPTSALARNMPAQPREGHTGITDFPRVATLNRSGPVKRDRERKTLSRGDTPDNTDESKAKKRSALRTLDIGEDEEAPESKKRTRS